MLCYTTGVIGFVLGGTLAAQTADVEEKLRLELLRLRLQQLQMQQAQSKQPTPKLVPLVAGAMPAGAVARLGDTRLRHAAPPTCVTFSPDSKRVFTGGQDGAIRVWSVATGQAVTTLQLGYTPTAMRFTPDRSKLAVSADSAIRFLHPDTLAHTAAFSTGNSSEFAISGDGKLVMALAGTGLVTVTELNTALPKLELPPGGRFAFHPDGKSVALADAKGKVTLYRVAGGKPVATFDHGSPVNGLVFSPDGKRLITGGSAPNVVKVWDLGTAKNPKPVSEIMGATNPRAWIGNDQIAAAEGSGAGVYDLTQKKWVGFAKGISGEWAVSPDGTKLAATGTNGLRVRLWDLTTGKQLHAANDNFPDPALLLPTADGQAVFILAGNAAFRWPVGQVTASPAGTLPGRALVAAIGGKRLAVAIPEGVLIYDDFDPMKPLPAKPSRMLTEQAAGCRSVAVSSDGKKVAYAGPAGEEPRIVIADAGKGTTLRVLPPPHTAGLALAFSPDGKRLAVVGRDGFLRVWPVERPTGSDTELWKVRIQRGLHGGVAFSPDGKLLAASSSGRLAVVNAADGKENFYLDRVDFDDGIFQHVVFSPDGRLLITGSAGLGGAVQVWELATGSLVRRYTTGFGSVSRLGVFADGSRIVSAGAEEVVTVWDLTFRHGTPTTAELLTAWGELDSLDAAKGYPALRALAAGGSKGLRVIAAGIQDTRDTQKSVANWVKQLGSNDFLEREAATKSLLGQGIRALPAVQQAAARADSPEVRSRAAEIVDKFTAKGVRLPAPRAGWRHPAAGPGRAGSGGRWRTGGQETAPRNRGPRRSFWRRGKCRPEATGKVMTKRESCWKPRQAAGVLSCAACRGAAPYTRINPHLRRSTAMTAMPCPIARFAPTVLACGVVLMVFGVALNALPSSGGQQPGKPPAAKAPEFPGWPKDKKPDAVLVITGQTYGYLQPCGCSRPQLGGLERRANFMASLKAAGWPVAAVDLGDMLPVASAVPRQGVLKYAITMNTLREMGYLAVGVGKAEFTNGLYQILEQYAANKAQAPFTLCGNVGSMIGGRLTRRAEAFPGPGDRPMVGLTAVAEVGTTSVGITGVVGPSITKEVEALGRKTLVGFTSPADTLKAAVKELGADPKEPQLNILLFQGTLEEAKQIPGEFPQFQAIVCLSTESEPPTSPTTVAAAAGKKTLIIQVGWKGRYVGVLGAFKRADGGFDLKYQRVALGEEFVTPGDEDAARKTNPVLLQLDKYAETVKTKNFMGEFPQGQHPAQLKDSKLAFVGSEKCVTCHAAESAKWNQTAHSHALDSLEKVAKRPSLRNFDPECVVCHTVGFGYRTGFRDAKTTPWLMHVGCESCHGPGSGHAANPKDAKLLALQSPWRTERTDQLPDLATMEKLAKLDLAERGRFPLKAAEKRMFDAVTDHCKGCHDPDNDPRFDLATYWPKIHHAAKK